LAFKHILYFSFSIGICFGGRNSEAPAIANTCPLAVTLFFNSFALLICKVATGGQGRVKVKNYLAVYNLQLFSCWSCSRFVFAMLLQVLLRTRATANKRFAAMLAGRWFNRPQFALGFGFGGTLIFQLCNLTSVFNNNFGCGSRRDEFQNPAQQQAANVGCNTIDLKNYLTLLFYDTC
jgi:hypothetical protein